MRATRRKFEFSSCQAGLVLAIALAFPPAARAEQLPLKTYTTSEGLARDYVIRILRDSHGFLWFCTPEGLSRFDGYNFVNYGPEQGLPRGPVWDLLEASDGAYWIATSEGVRRFHLFAAGQNKASTGNEPGAAALGILASAPTFVAYRPSGGDRAQVINVIREDHNGAIWCGTNAGLFRLEEVAGKWIFSETEIGLPTSPPDHRVISTLLADRRGALWIGGISGLYRRLPDGRVERYTTEHGLLYNDVRALLENGDGRIWVGTTLGLCQLVPEPDPRGPVVARAYTVKTGLADNYVTSLVQTADGRLWIGTDGGLTEFLPFERDAARQFRSYTTTQGLSVNQIVSLGEDTDGNLWIGTESGGAMKLARNGFAAYTEADGLKGTRVASIFEDAAGELCVISSHASELFMHRFDGAKFTAIKPNLRGDIKYSWGWNQIVLQDRAREWWVPTAEGLYRFARANKVEELGRMRPSAVYTIRNGLPGNEIFRVYEDSRGDIWLSIIGANRDTLARWERATGEVYRYTEAEGLPPSDGPTAFREDSVGNLWIGLYSEGLVRYRAGKFTRFSLDDGLPLGLIRDLYLDHRGKLWIATDRGGVACVDDPSAERPRFIKYTTSEGLASNQVTCVTEDQQGRIYIGTPRGVDRLDPSTGHVKHYTEADGLANNFVNVAYRDRRGALWFGTLQGLSELIPEAERPVSPPPILISKLRVAGVEQMLSDLRDPDLPGLVLAPDRNQVQIDFVGMSFGVGEALRYQYKLDGAEKDWSALSDQRSVNYAQLAPGAYRFMVRAVTADGTVSLAPAVVSFRILRPVWQRWWFLAIAALFIAGTACLVHKYRVNRLLELERVRTRIATDLHDDIGSSLSQIAILSEVVRQQVGHDNAAVTEPLSQITASSSELMDTMSDIVWAIDPHKDRLTDLIQRMRRFASDVLTSRNIDFEFHAPEGHRNLNLGADVRRQVFLVCKESINNIVRHSACSRVDIEFRLNKDRITLAIRDNGRGFDTAYESDGHGLLSMGQRAREMEGTLEVRSQPGEGTTVTLEVPISGRSKARTR